MENPILFDDLEDGFFGDSNISEQPYTIATDELVRTRARLQHLIDFTPTIIYSSVSSGDFKLTFISENVFKVLGYSATEVLEDPDFWFNHIHVDDRPKIFQELPQLFVKNEHCHEYRFQHKNGQYCWIKDRLRLVRDSDGEPVEIIGSMDDITIQKDAEEVLKSDRDGALKLAQMKSEFLANMSHEIRTPMNGVLGMLNLLQTTNLTNEQRDYVAIAYNSGDALLTVLNDILDFSKIEAGKLELDNIDFNLRETIEDIADLFAGQAQEKGVELISVIPVDVHETVHADPARLRQVLANLLSNAIKFTQQGEVVIRLKVKSVYNNKYRIRFEIRDTGVGISPEAQQRIFQSFEQADGSTTRIFGGTGLGLAITKRLVELMDGVIGVDSEVNAGSTFWFELIFAEPLKSKLKRWTPNPELNGLRALIADEKSVSRKYVCHLMSHWGIDTSDVKEAKQALEVLRAFASHIKPFDLLILNHHLSDVEEMMVLAKQIKSDERIAKTHIIMLTPMGWQSERLVTKQSQITGITKPIRQLQLHDCIFQLTSKQASPFDPSIAKPALILEKQQESVVLVVEDNIVNQKVTLGMLKKIGCVCDLAVDGNEAVEAVKANTYDLILMDCQMPNMDGYQATYLIREHELKAAANDASLRRTPIIALTAHTMAENINACFDSGMDDYLIKPVNVSKLQKKLMEWVPKDE